MFWHIFFWYSFPFRNVSFPASNKNLWSIQEQRLINSEQSDWLFIPFIWLRFTLSKDVVQLSYVIEIWISCLKMWYNVVTCDCLNSESLSLRQAPSSIYQNGIYKTADIVVFIFKSSTTNEKTTNFCVSCVHLASINIHHNWVVDLSLEGGS